MRLKTVKLSARLILFGVAGLVWLLFWPLSTESNAAILYNEGGKRIALPQRVIYSAEDANTKLIIMIAWQYHKKNCQLPIGLRFMWLNSFGVLSEGDVYTVEISPKSTRFENWLKFRGRNRLYGRGYIYSISKIDKKIIAPSSVSPIPDRSPILKSLSHNLDKGSLFSELPTTCQLMQGDCSKF